MEGKLIKATKKLPAVFLKNFIVVSKQASPKSWERLVKYYTWLEWYGNSPTCNLQWWIWSTFVKMNPGLMSVSVPKTENTFF